MRPARFRPRRPAISSWRCNPSSSPILSRSSPRRVVRTPWSRRAWRARNRRAAAIRDLLDAQRLPAGQRHHVLRELRPWMMGRSDILRAAAIIALIVVIIAAFRVTNQRAATPPAADLRIPSAADDLSAELRRCSALGPTGCRRPALRGGLGGKSPPLLRRAGAAVNPRRPRRANVSTTSSSPDRERRDDQRRRHRYFPQHVHDLHRFRLRPHQRRRRLSVARP